MFFCIYALRALCQDCTHTEVFESGANVRGYQYQIEKGQKLCIKSEVPNTAIVFSQIESTRVTVGETAKYGKKLQSRRKYEDKVGLYFRDYACINMTALKNTLWDFYIMEVPYSCRERIWASNQPDTFRFENSDEPTCAFFANNIEIDYSIERNLGGDDKIMMYTENQKKRLSSKVTTKRLRNALFEIIINSQKKNKYVSIKADFDINSVSRPFSRFLDVYKSAKTSDKSAFKGFMKSVMLLVMIVGIAGLVYYVIRYKKTHNNDIGYMSIHTVAGPRTLI